jgi:hypothetical protein
MRNKILINIALKLLKWVDESKIEHINSFKHYRSKIEEESDCSHEFVPKKCWVHKCIKCNELHVEK